MPIGQSKITIVHMPRLLHEQRGIFTSYTFKATQSGLNHKKSVLLFWLFDMAIRCEYVHRLELWKSFKFLVAVAM